MNLFDIAVKSSVYQTKRRMKLNTAQKKIQYTIINIQSIDEEMTSRFYKLGIFPGVIVKLLRKAPIFSDPLLFDVEGAQIALTNKEASYIEVELTQENACQQ